MSQQEQSQLEDLKNQVRFLSNLVENLTNSRPICPVVPVTNYATWKSYKQALKSDVVKKHFGNKEERFKRYGEQHRSYVFIENYTKSASSIANNIFKYSYGLDSNVILDSKINNQELLDVYIEIYERVLGFIRRCEEEFNERIKSI